jgi:hypothetical protein
MAIAAAKLRELHEDTRTAVCPAEFATTDRICQRWSVSVGTGQPTERWQDHERSRPPPLDDGTAIVVDQIILRAPASTRKVVVKWYRTDLPDTVIAQQLNLTPRTLVVAWHLSLNFLRWRFSESGHRDLLAALRWRE